MVFVRSPGVQGDERQIVESVVRSLLGKPKLTTAGGLASALAPWTDLSSYVRPLAEPRVEFLQ